MRTRIKFCGITRVEDAQAAAMFGADAIGLVFTRHSRRFVEPAQAGAIRRALPPFVATVALFMDDTREWIEEVIEVVQPDLLQFHGAEPAGFALRFGRPYLKAVPMASHAGAIRHAASHPLALALLLDSHVEGSAGGTGAAFDWSQAPRFDRPIVLAGGLDAGNVARAMALVRPFAVDVSSGIESAPGIKDVARMRAFVEAVRIQERAEAAADPNACRIPASPGTHPQTNSKD